MLPTVGKGLTGKCVYLVCDILSLYLIIVRLELSHSVW